MLYAFLEKAKAEPDLSDFCDYVKKPLSVLEDILHRYEQLQLTKKVTTENLEIYHRCDSILQKHLPEMVDNFCNFSFEYRNNEKIHIDYKTSLTAKEILLKNLAKIIEEVKLIEKNFNHNNSFQTLAQTKVLSNYGFQPELSLETGKITHEKIELENKFDYTKFVESHDFKETKVAKQDKIVNVPSVKTIENIAPKKPILDNQEKKTGVAVTKETEDITSKKTISIKKEELLASTVLVNSKNNGVIQNNDEVAREVKPLEIILAFAVIFGVLFVSVNGAFNKPDVKVNNVSQTILNKPTDPNVTELKLFPKLK